MVPEVLNLLATSGLELVSFIMPIRYDPTLYLKDQDLRKKARKLGTGEQAALAENLAGNMKTHSFYAHKAGGGAPGFATQRFESALASYFSANPYTLFGPTQLSSTETLVSSITGAAQETSRTATETVFLEEFVGPFSFLIGDLGLCTSFSAQAGVTTLEHRGRRGHG